MTRAVCVFLPDWSIDLVRRRSRAKTPYPDPRPDLHTNPHTNPPTGERALQPADRPPSQIILLSARIGQREVVMRCCHRARAAGVREAMPMAEARALLPAGCIRVESFRPERDRAALRALARWCRRFSPIVATDDPDGLLLDVRGCERVFKGLDRLVHAIAEGIERLGLRAQVAAASTFACAWAAARFGHEPGRIVPPGHEREALAPMPVRALRLDEQTAAELREVGIERVEHLLAMPRADLADRFAGDLLLRIDQALGLAWETIEPIRPGEPIRADRELDGPVTRPEAIELVARTLLERVCSRLDEQERGARRLDVELTRVDAPPVRLGITLSRPARRFEHLWALLGPHLERANLGFGVERVSITAARTQRLRHGQGELDAAHTAQTTTPSMPGEQWHGKGDPRNDRLVGELVDVLSNRLGPDRVVRIDPIPSHVPERTFVPMPWSGKPTGTPRGEIVIRGDRPPLLLERPEPAQVLAAGPDGPVVRLCWRGRSRRIVASLGPERIGGCWWRGPEATRDYFKIQDDRGCWLWVYHELETDRWLVHGRWT